MCHITIKVEEKHTSQECEVYFPSPALSVCLLFSESSCFVIWFIYLFVLNPTDIAIVTDNVQYQCDCS